MTNEEKIKAWCEYDSNNMDMYEMIVAAEREKLKSEMLNAVMTDAEFEEYTGSKRKQPDTDNFYCADPKRCPLKRATRNGVVILI